MTVEIFRQRVATESFTVSAADVLAGLKDLSLPVLSPADALVMVNGAEWGSGSYEFAKTSGGPDGGSLKLKPGTTWAAGDKVVVLHRRKMYDLYRSLMTSATDEGPGRSLAKSFAELTVQQHEWALDIFATVFEALDLKVQELEKKLSSVKQAYNAHVHPQGETPQPPSALIE